MYIATLHLVDQRMGALACAFDSYPTMQSLYLGLYNTRLWNKEEWAVISQKLKSMQMPDVMRVNLNPTGVFVSFPDTNIVLTIQRVSVCQG